MMGLVVNVPVALAPGMGLNGYFNTIAGNSASCYTKSAFHPPLYFVLMVAVALRLLTCALPQTMFLAVSR